MLFKYLSLYYSKSFFTDRLFNKIFTTTQQICCKFSNSNIKIKSHLRNLFSKYDL